MMIDRGKEIDRFAETITVDEVMSHNVFTVRPETSLAAAVELLRRHRIGSLPVVKNKKLVGIITRSDILDFVLSRAPVNSPVEQLGTPRKHKPRPPKRAKTTSPE
jgi:CBS domain-containing protein